MAWNEPGGGNKPRDPWGNRPRGNPGNDLDDAVRKAGDRLKGLFGGGGGGGSGDISSLVMPAAVVVLILWTLMGIYRLEAADQGIVLRFGAYHSTIGAGLHWQPWLVDEVRRVNVSQVQQATMRASMITADQNLVDIDLEVQYRVGDAKAYLLRVASAESVLAHATESALRHVVGNSNLTQVITEGRANVAVGVQPRLQSYLDRYQTGMTIQQVNILEAQPPKEVSDAFIDVVRAKEDRDRLINEARAYANGIVPEARGKAQRMLEEGEAYRQDIIARAEGDAARFNSLYAEYRRAPAVTRDRLYLETMQEVYGKSTTVIVDTKGSNIVNLPSELLSGNRVRPETAVAADGAAQAGGSGAAEPRERTVDRLRNRREETR
jgi:membrane protease subunit HflK